MAAVKRERRTPPRNPEEERLVLIVDDDPSLLLSNAKDLKHPMGVAVAQSGYIYGADTGDNRALKLSSLGQVVFELDGLGHPEGVALDAAGLVAVSTGVEYGPDGTAFQAPVTVVVPYDPAAAQAQGLSELGLQVHYWDAGRQKWVWLSSVVDPLSHTVSAKTMHFSLYKVVGRRGRQ